MNSKIIICNNIRLDRDYINTLNYTEQQMLTLCQQNAIATAENYSFLQDTGGIYVAFTYNQCIRANYIAYQNPDYSNKWFFAWIDKVIYKGNKNCELQFTVDSWATWFPNLTINTCFVEREHVNDDTIGLHTIEENLDVGEVIEESKEEYLAPEGDPESISYSNSNYYFAIEGTYNPITGRDMEGVGKNNGSLNGNWIFLFKAYDGSVGLPEIRNFINAVNGATKIDSIKNIYILPEKLVDQIGKTKYETTSQVFGNYSFYLLHDSSEIVTETHNFNVIHSFNDYQNVKNNKLFCYPYNFMLATNNIGNYNIYKYENFYSESPSFLIEMAVSIGASIRLVPQNYKNIDKNYDESIPLAKFPTCSWSADSFTNWLTQNSVNIVTNVGTIAGSLALAYATGGTSAIVQGATILSTATSIANTIGQFHKANLLPSISGGNNTGDVNFSARKNTFIIHHMRCKKEYLEILDNYFSKFGYKINRLKVPNITGRRYWNYVEIGKTEEIGHGIIPTNDLEIINNAFRKGVTIWHEHSNIGNYNLNNTIVS